MDKVIIYSDPNIFDCFFIKTIKEEKDLFDELKNTFKFYNKNDEFIKYIFTTDVLKVNDGLYIKDSLNEGFYSDKDDNVLDFRQYKDKNSDMIKNKYEKVFTKYEKYKIRVRTLLPKIRNSINKRVNK